MWIVASSPSESTAQRLQFTYGVLPEHLPVRPDTWQGYVRDWVERYHIEGDLALLTRGTSPHHKLGANLLEVIDLDSPDVEPLW
jgi:hypothetical protein